jgi:hypothetical protein
MNKEQVAMMKSIVDSSEEHMASINFSKLQDLCRVLRGSNIHDIRLTQSKKVLCAYVLERNKQLQADHIVQASVKMTEYDQVFMQTCQNSESVGPLFAFCNYLLQNYMIHRDPDDIVLGQYQEYVLQQGCSRNTDRRCRDCATIKYVMNTSVAQKFIAINRNIVNVYLHQRWSMVSFETLSHSFNSILHDLETTRFRLTECPQTPSSQKAQEFGLIRMLFLVFFVMLSYSVISIRSGGSQNTNRPRPVLLQHEETGSSLVEDNAMSSQNDLVRNIQVRSKDLESVQLYTERASWDLEAEAYWRRKFPRWTLELSEIPGSTPVQIDYTKYELLGRLNVILRAGIREVYISPHRSSRMSWVRKLALTLSKPMSVPKRGNFPNNNGHFGERSASESDYATMLGTSGNFLGVKKDFVVSDISNIFGRTFRDKIVRYYVNHQNPVLDLHNEQLRIGMYSTYRLYLLNFCSDLHRVIYRNHPEVPQEEDAFQEAVNGIWFEATSQWLQNGKTSYSHLDHLLGEVYGRS